MGAFLCLCLCICICICICVCICRVYIECVYMYFCGAAGGPQLVAELGAACRVEGGGHTEYASVIMYKHSCVRRFPCLSFQLCERRGDCWGQRLVNAYGVCGDSMMTLLCGSAAPAYMLAPWVNECRCQGASCPLIIYKTPRFWIT